VSLKGYRAFHLHAIAGQTRGCSILVKDSIPCSRVLHPADCGEDVEVLVVTIILPRMPLTFCCLYSGQNAEPDLYELFALASEEPSFIGGDFNAHHEMWGSKRRNRAGRHLSAIVEEAERVKLLNAGVPTHVAGRVLDLSFVTNPLEVGAEWSLHSHLALCDGGVPRCPTAFRSASSGEMEHAEGGLGEVPTVSFHHLPRWSRCCRGAHRTCVPHGSKRGHPIHPLTTQGVQRQVELYRGSPGGKS